MIAPEGTFHLSPAFPNPFHDAARLTLTLQRDQHVHVALFDLMGRRRALLHDGFLSPGDAHTFRVEGSGLPNGLYVIRVTGDHFTTAASVVLRR